MLGRNDLGLRRRAKERRLTILAVLRQGFVGMRSCRQEKQAEQNGLVRGGRRHDVRGARGGGRCLLPLARLHEQLTRAGLDPAPARPVAAQ